MLKLHKYYNIYRGCWIGLCVEEEGWGQGGGTFLSEAS